MDSAFFYDPWTFAAGRHHHHHHHRSRGRDMESPFYYSVDPRSTAAPRRHYRPYSPEPEPSAAPAYASRPPVISVPVSFVGSKGGDKIERAPSAEAVRSAAAVAIQRAFRGYLVRKNMKVVSQVAAVLGAIERSVRSKEERLRADPKERLRLNEMLMALLFSLDSVRGIRDYRKKVIRRVIVLQEFLDSISAGILESTNSSGTEAPIVAEMRLENLDSDLVHQEPEESPNNSIEESMTQDCQDPAAGVAEEVVPREDKDLAPGEDKDAQTQERDPISAAPNDGFETPDHVMDLGTAEEMAADDEFVVVSMEEVTGTSPTGPNSDKSPAFETMEQENRETTAAQAEEAPGIPTTTTTMGEGAIEQEAPKANSTAGASGMEEVLKKVMAESERLQGLVAALCARNAQQCQLLVGLVDRVGHLERAIRRMEKEGKKEARRQQLHSSR